MILIADSGATKTEWGRGAYGRNNFYALTGSWEGYDHERLMVYDFMTENK